MKQKDSRLSREERELMESIEYLMENVNSDPAIANIPVPPELEEDIRTSIRIVKAEEEQKAKEARTEELVRLGLIYERKRSHRKYYVLAAAMVLAMAFGITSLGGAGKIFETVRIMTLGREQTHVNSDKDVVIETDFTEDEVYEKIEEKYGFLPVKLDYLPEGVEFLEASIDDEILGMHIFYGKDDVFHIKYLIRPNYRNGSWGNDVEDELLERYEKIIDGVCIQIEKYRIKDGSIRWMIQYEYKNVSYSLLCNALEENEVEKVISNLYFN